MKRSPSLDVSTIFAGAFTVLAILASIAPALFYRDVRYDSTVAVLTLTLIAVIWYTYFTHRLTKLSEQSLRHAEESLATSREREAAQQKTDLRSLQLCIERLQKYLSALPAGIDDKVVGKLRNSVEPPVEDIKMLRELATKIGREQHELANSAALEIEKVLPYIRGAKGNDYNQDQRDRYTEGLPAALRLLAGLHSRLESSNASA